MAQKNGNTNPGRATGNELHRNLLSGYAVPTGRGKEEIWDSVVRKVSEASYQQKGVFAAWSSALRVAAILLPFTILTSLAAAYFIGRAEYRTGAGRQITVLLPDSSTVTLNAESMLKYNRSFWFLSRSVHLEGEALFMVKKGKTFSVHTALATTQVLGTAFNVYNRKNEVRVTCLEGRVKVTSRASSQSVVLVPGSKTRLVNASLGQPVATNIQDEAGWTRGEFRFAGEPIGVVFDELARQFDVKIELNANPGRQYTGFFRNDSLERALDLVCQPMGLSWKRNGNTILISSDR